MLIQKFVSVLFYNCVIVICFKIYLFGWRVFPIKPSVEEVQENDNTEARGRTSSSTFLPPRWLKTMLVHYRRPSVKLVTLWPEGAMLPRQRQ